MLLLNLSLGELLAIFLPVAAGVVALYLYDRSRRRQVVSTLLFFPRESRAPVLVRRKKIQQPWSLLLQLASLALLLAAIAEPQWGRRAEQARDHVLILETSAWMSSGGGNPLMEQARRRALDYLRAVPGRDRVLLLRADALPTPVTAFTANRRELEQGIRGSQPGSTALDLSAALELAGSLQRAGPARSGEIAFVGSGRVMRSDLDRVESAGAGNLRAILLGAEPNDCGIRKLAARRSPNDLLEWEIVAGAHNYGAVERRHTVRLRFAGARAGARSITLAPHSTAEAAFRLRSSDPGLLEATLDARDDYPADNRAAIELPALAPLKVQVYTTQPARWQPLLATSRFLEPEFHAPADYRTTGPARRLVVLDGWTPSAAPDADSVWIAAAGPGSSGKVAVGRWNAIHPIAAGLFNKDVQLARAGVLTVGAGEVAVAESAAGPVLVASTGGAHKKLRFAFHPLDEGTDNHLAIPLLFANLVRWVSPDLFRLSEVSAGPPGLIEIEVPPGTRRDQVQVKSPQIRDLPFTLTENRMRLFAGRPGTVRVTLPEREMVYTLSQPEVGEVRWQPPAGVRQGVPPPAAATRLGAALWPWLALAGALGLLLEWAWFGRNPAAAVTAGPKRTPVEPAESSQPSPAAQEVTL